MPVRGRGAEAEEQERKEQVSNVLLCGRGRPGGRKHTGANERLPDGSKAVRGTGGNKAAGKQAEHMRTVL